MNGKTEESAGSMEGKNTRMSYEVRTADNGLWLNYFEGADTRSCASFFMTVAETEAFVTYLNKFLRDIEEAKWAARVAEDKKLAARNHRLEDYQ